MDPDLVLKAITAIAPVLILLLVFDRLDMFDLVSFREIGALLLIGAGIAALSFVANWRVMDGFPIGFSSYTRNISPVIEETLKAIPIVVLFSRNRLGFKLDCAIAGFAVGAGFSIVENIWYLTILPDANLSAWLVRGFGTAIMHGGATAIFAVIAQEFSETQVQAAEARYRFNPILFLPGLALAIALHSAFNHFPNQPMLAMAITLLVVPMTLFFVFARSEQATHVWIKSDYEAHQRALADIRAGRFAESEAGKAITQAVSRVRDAKAGDVFGYIELKTELILRAEEIMLATQDGRQIEPGDEDRAKFKRLAELERKLGWSLLTAIRPRLGFSRNDLWELARLRSKLS